MGLGQSQGDGCFSRTVSMVTSLPSFPLTLSLENSASFLDPKPWPPLRKSLPSGPLDLLTTTVVKAGPKAGAVATLTVTPGPVSCSRPCDLGNLCPSDNGHGGSLARIYRGKICIFRAQKGAEGSKNLRPNVWTHTRPPTFTHMQRTYNQNAGRSAHTHRPHVNRGKVDAPADP